jgi:hypothetical protein
LKRFDGARFGTPTNNSSVSTVSVDVDCGPGPLSFRDVRFQYCISLWLLAMVGPQEREENGLDASVAAFPPIVVIFGKPGAGKTTVATAAIAKLDEERTTTTTTTTKPSSLHPTDQTRQHFLKCLSLDLDVCVPQWMRDNFAQGIYPTLAQRQDFALSCCDYVEHQVRDCNSRQQQPLLLGMTSSSSISSSISIQEKGDTATGVPSSLIQPQEVVTTTTTLVAFSFVNTDLRDTFRSRFPNATWVLIDTNDKEAMHRINQREGHFYKGQQKSNESDQPPNETLFPPDKPPNETLLPPKTSDTNTTTKPQQQDENSNSNTTLLDNTSDWTFAPVTFPHVVLDGKNSIESNAVKVLEILWETSSQYNNKKSR